MPQLVAIVDCETTGLSKEDEPIAIAALLVSVAENGESECVEKWFGYQDPSVAIHPMAQRVHGLTYEFLAGKAFDLVELGKILDKAEVLIAHHAVFDARMLDKVVFGGVIDRKEWRCSLRQWPFGNIGGKKLDDICRHFKIERPASHDAMKDAMALYEALNRRSGKTSRSRTYMQILLQKKPYHIRDVLERSRITGKGNGYGVARPKRRMPPRTGDFVTDVKNLWRAMPFENKFKFVYRVLGFFVVVYILYLVFG